MTRPVVFAAVSILGAMPLASARIVPSWQVNTITPAAISLAPQLVGGISVSLMVELSGGSLFNVAGLDLTSAFPGAIYYNPIVTVHLPGRLPPGGIFDWEFDTYVTTTSPNQAPVVPSRYVGSGSPQVGNGGFNAAWAAMPNTPGTELSEIARITFPGGQGLVVDAVGTPVNGEVRDNLHPNVSIRIPSIPIVVPEPAGGVLLAGLGLVRWRRRG